MLAHSCQLCGWRHGEGRACIAVVEIPPGVEGLELNPRRGWIAQSAVKAGRRRAAAMRESRGTRAENGVPVRKERLRRLPAAARMEFQR